MDIDHFVSVYYSLIDGVLKMPCTYQKTDPTHPSPRGRTTDGGCGAGRRSSATTTTTA